MITNLFITVAVNSWRKSDSDCLLNVNKGQMLIKVKMIRPSFSLKVDIMHEPAPVSFQYSLGLEGIHTCFLQLLPLFLSS